MSKKEKKELEQKTSQPGDSRQKPDEGKNQTSQINERPRICAIDVEEKSVQALKSHGFNCYSGTLGSLVKVPNIDKYKSHLCLLDFDFPPNLHEYDIVIIDLQNPIEMEYIKENQTNMEKKGYTQSALRSSFPETIFDPRAFSAKILADRLPLFMAKESIVVVFGAKNEKIEYHPVSITNRGEKSLNTEIFSLYDFYSDLPPWKNIMGKDSSIVLKEQNELRSLLVQHNDEAIYKIAFYRPTRADGDRYVKKDIFIPLMETELGWIISFAIKEKENITFFFPQIKHKEAFLTWIMQQQKMEVSITL